MREELVSLKRRIALRAGGSADSEPLSDHDVDRLAAAVAERLATWFPS